MEYARGEGGVGPALRQDFLDVSDASRPTGGDHGDGEFIRETGICLYGIAVPGSVVIHGGEEDLTGTEVLDFFGPGIQLLVGRRLAAVGHYLPVSIAVQGCSFDRLSGHRSDRPRVNRHDNKLGAVA